MAEQVVEINVREDSRYKDLTSKWWQAGYTVLSDTAHVKYILIDFRDGIEIIVSKVVHSFGARYYVSVPRKRVATSMLVSLTDTSNTKCELLHGHVVLLPEEVLTIAEVLQDVGDF